MKDRTAALNRGRYARHKVLRWQNRYRYAQIESQINALDASVQRVANADAALSPTPTCWRPCRLCGSRLRA